MLAGGQWLVPDESGTCPQFDRSSRLCRIHLEHGEAMLPHSCFQFPRRALIDERGTFVTLSHFCPTAAGMLVDATAPLTIVGSPHAFPSGREYDGLDARNDWPPLLRPDVLFDPPSYECWEHFLVRVLGSSDAGVDATLQRLASAAERLRCWTPADGSMLDWTHRVLDGDGIANGDSSCVRRSSIDAYDLVTRAVPDGLNPPPRPTRLDEIDPLFVAPHWKEVAPVVLRYVATKAFASWTAYQGRGVRTQVAELFLAAGVLRVECARACEAAGARLDRQQLVEAVRAADWLLMHLVDRALLISALAGVETHASANAQC